MSLQTLPSKFVGETVDIDFDMLSRLEVGQTIATAAVNISVFSGTDPNPTSMLSGVATISGTMIRQRVMGGLPGVIYMVWASARTNNGEILINEATLAVLSSNATIPPP